jgi:hypothetical protein
MPRRRRVIFRLLGTGSRNLTDMWAVGRVLGDRLTKLPPGSTLIAVHGAHDEGFDKIMHSWATSPTIAARYPDYTVVAEPHPADWWRDCDQNCRHRPRRPGGRCAAAGPLRNQFMVDLGADECIAWPLGDGWSGTRDCMRRATAAGIRVMSFGD